MHHSATSGQIALLAHQKIILPLRAVEVADEVHLLILPLQLLIGHMPLPVPRGVGGPGVLCLGMFWITLWAPQPPLSSRTRVTSRNFSSSLTWHKCQVDSRFLNNGTSTNSILYIIDSLRRDLRAFKGP